MRPVRGDRRQRPLPPVRGRVPHRAAAHREGHQGPPGAVSPAPGRRRAGPGGGLGGPGAPADVRRRAQPAVRAGRRQPGPAGHRGPALGRRHHAPPGHVPRPHAAPRARRDHRDVPHRRPAPPPPAARRDRGAAQAADGRAGRTRAALRRRADRDPVQRAERPVAAVRRHPQLARGASGRERLLRRGTADRLVVLTTGTLPTGLAALLLSRVERVSDAAQQVLRAAAVAGGGAADDLVRAASGLPDDVYEEARPRGGRPPAARSRRARRVPVPARAAARGRLRRPDAGGADPAARPAREPARRRARRRRRARAPQHGEPRHPRRVRRLGPGRRPRPSASAPPPKRTATTTWPWNCGCGWRRRSGSRA